jgi:short subunit dehydrogenase-like uncharacterized protein
VLLTTVGPYDRLGRPVVEAALDNGCHYVDVSGELRFLEWVYQQEHRAEAAGVVLAPGAGLDGATGDLLAAICAEELEGDVRSLRAAYLIRGGRSSRGSARTMLDVVAAGGAAWIGGLLVPEAVAADAWDAPFPEPLGTRTGVSLPLPEVITGGRTTSARTVRVYGVAPGLPFIRPVAEAAARLGRLTSSTPLWALGEQAAGVLPEGPAPEQRVKARAAVLVEAAGPPGRARAWARLTDIYATTATFAVALARRLLDPATTPARGTRTPAQVAGDAGAFLDEAGVLWERC